MGVLDFLVAWDIGTIILAAGVLAIVVLAGSYGLAFAWRRWKEKKRAAARARGRHPPAVLPTPATGLRFGRRAAVTKLPKPSFPKPEGRKPSLPRPSLPRLGRKKRAP